MANRSYVYRCDEIPDGKRPVRPLGLHEWNWDVPLVHQLLLAAEPQLVTFADYDEDHVGVLARRDDAFAIAVFDTIGAGELEDRAEFDAELAAMKVFLAARPSAYVLADATELFMMSSGPHQRQASALVTKIKKTAGSARRAVEGSGEAWLSGIRASWRDKARLGDFYDDLAISLEGRPRTDSAPRAYVATETYAVDVQIAHPVFGTGIVTASDGGKLTALFGTAKRMLIQGKS